jgi:hypothetical protein
MAKTVKNPREPQHVPKGKTHPYLAWESTPLWRAIDKAVADLAENQDLVGRR